VETRREGIDRMSGGNGIDIGSVYRILPEVARAVAGHDRKLDDIADRLDDHDAKLDDIVGRLDGHDRKLNEIIGVVNEHTGKLDQLAEVVNRHDPRSTTSPPTLPGCAKPRRTTTPRSSAMGSC
jgi:hypothetical protein